MIFRQEYNNRYVKKLPVAGVTKVRFKTGVELMRLKSGRKKWATGNIELRDGLPLFIYSEYSQRYWYRILRSDHDLAHYRHLIAQGILYIYFDEIWRSRVSEEVLREGMGYYSYNRLRELTLLDLYLDKNKDDEQYVIKKRAIKIEIDKIKENEKHKKVNTNSN